MKRFIAFISLSIIAYFVLQVGSGILLTFFYEPRIEWGSAKADSQVEIFGTVNIPKTLIMAIIALGIAFSAMKILNKKAS